CASAHRRDRWAVLFQHNKDAYTSLAWTLPAHSAERTGNPPQNNFNLAYVASILGIFQSTRRWRAKFISPAAPSTAQSILLRFLGASPLPRGQIVPHRRTPCGACR